MFVQFFGKRKRIQRLTSAIVILAGSAAISNEALAQAPGPKPAADPPVRVVLVEPKPVEFGGLGWELGIATNFDVGGNRVNTAAVVNNIIRVDDTSSNASVSFVLEAHYFLTDRFFGLGGSKDDCTARARNNLNCTELAHGPFVAIEVGGGSSATAASGPITGYAMGWMVGMRHPSLIPDIATAKSSWNVGVGLRISPAGKVLGDGLIANQPLPAVTRSLKTEPRLGVMLMSTFSY